VITTDKVGKLDDNLKKAITEALLLDGQDCRNYALNYSWTKCTEQFFSNLVPAFAEIKQLESDLVAEHYIK
jgi:hypothetical protein